MKSNSLVWDNITQPSKTGFQVRIVRRNQEYSRYFSINSWGGKTKAFRAANNWRDMTKIALRKNTRRLLNPSSKNKTTGYAGISRTTSYDNRKNLRYLVYHACWTDYTGKVRIKTFRACNVANYSADMDRKAIASAIKFRQDWENHADADTLHDFDPTAYNDWRSQSYEMEF
jgi:hypothetical protein